MAREYNVRSQCDTDGNPEYIYWGVHGWTENQREAHDLPYDNAKQVADTLRAQGNALEGKFYNVTIVDALPHA